MFPANESPVSTDAVLIKIIGFSFLERKNMQLFHLSEGSSSLCHHRSQLWV